MDNTKTQTNNDSFPCLVVGRSMYDAPACTLTPQYLNVSLVAACTALRASMETDLAIRNQVVTIIMSISNKSLLPTRPLKVNREGEAYYSDYQLADIILMP
ncbi:Hypothetical Protein CGB_F4270W [Cryptococcus gattii WM276]|uniref:Uncharacterized protein n=1 Tax=Cryptococcus gattii serotype B (strain WM276 / ATCC MYA-4071) TaxID=367775 RepID=E6R8B8_CRYGW|nr:Hypothetical Protein CGB_F4270W [Cryptococcus gattii WM276]ADV23026.1 Hypothetical Protein CGB_F4270W [Cryptococcus gattii WM276]KJE04159.1 hypothetical protein I311_01966 [Cryptococcus gattii NT-10]